MTPWAESCHDGARGADGGLAHVHRLIPEAREEHGKDVDDVGFEKPPETHVEELERHERPLSRLRIGLIFHRRLDRVHDPEEFEGPDAHTLDGAGESKRRASAIGA